MLQFVACWFLQKYRSQHAILQKSHVNIMAEFCMMLQNSNMVFQNFNMAFQNFKGKGKGKGKGKDSGAGVGSTYANPGRPKSFQPTHQDRK